MKASFIDSKGTLNENLLNNSSELEKGLVTKKENSKKAGKDNENK